MFPHPPRLAKGRFSEKAGLSGRLSDSCAEREKLDLVMATLEELDDTDGTALANQKRRGRKSLSEAERRAVSERMKRYWAKRRQGR